MESLPSERKQQRYDVTTKEVFEFRQECNRIGRIKFNAHPILKSVQNSNNISYAEVKFKPIQIGNITNPNHKLDQDPEITKI